MKIQFLINSQVVLFLASFFPIEKKSIEVVSFSSLIDLFTKLIHFLSFYISIHSLHPSFIHRKVTPARCWNCPEISISNSLYNTKKDYSLRCETCS